MNRTAYIASLTADELDAEIALFEEEMLDYVGDLSAWRNYEFYLLLTAEWQERYERRPTLQQAA